MATITKNINSNDRFINISLDSLLLEYNLQITSNKIELTLTNTNDQFKLFQLELNLEDFKTNSKFCDQSWFGISNKVLPGGNFKLDVVKPLQNQLISLLPFSGLLKNKILVNTIDGNCDSDTNIIPFRIFFPHKSCDFRDCIIQVVAPMEGDLDHSISVVTNTGNTFIDEFIHWDTAFATISATGTIISDNINVIVNVSNTNIEYVYLEPVVGILDRLKVKLTNGTGSFNIKTDTLSTGESAEVKIGYKQYSNALTFTKIIL